MACEGMDVDAADVAGTVDDEPPGRVCRGLKLHICIPWVTNGLQGNADAADVAGTVDEELAG